MLMGDKYLVWVGPGSAAMQYYVKRISKRVQYMLNVFNLQYKFPFFNSNCISHKLYLKQGASVWIPDPDAVWVSALLLQDYSPGEKHLLLQLSNGKVRHYITQVSWSS